MDCHYQGPLSLAWVMEVQGLVATAATVVILHYCLVLRNWRMNLPMGVTTPCVSRRALWLLMSTTLSTVADFLENHNVFSSVVCNVGMGIFTCLVWTGFYLFKNT